MNHSFTHRSQRFTLRFSSLLLLALLCSAAARAGNFEGYNIVLEANDDATRTSGVCATTYMPPTTVVTVMKFLSGGGTTAATGLSSCGSGTTVTGNTFTANASTGYWCFSGPETLYQISFSGGSYGTITYNWIPTQSSSGFYNVKDFGAKGDGTTDDTIAFKGALAYIGTRNGGTLYVPQGDFAIGVGATNFRGLTLPSGLNLIGASSIYTGAPTGNAITNSGGASRIKLSASTGESSSSDLFRIGECTERVNLRDVELYASSNVGTNAVEAVGKYSNSAQDLSFDRLVFSNFNRGLYFHGLPDSNPLVSYGWQVDYVKVNHCRFVYNQDAGIYVDTNNTDWKITGCVFINPAKSSTVRADSIYIYRGGQFLVTDTYSGGFPSALGGDFINSEFGGELIVISSECESMTRSLVFGEAAATLGITRLYAYPLTLVGNVFGNLIDIKIGATFTSTGNLYGADTVHSVAAVKIYSTGDRFCYDSTTLTCNGGDPTKAKFIGGKLMFATGQQVDGSIVGRLTTIGTDAEVDTESTDASIPTLSVKNTNYLKPLLEMGQAPYLYTTSRDSSGWLNFKGTQSSPYRGYKFDAPVQLPSLTYANLPTGTPGNGSMVYCSDCARNTSPCSTGGSGGAPAMLVNGQWECK